jgi:hypothetical protein
VATRIETWTDSSLFLDQHCPRYIQQTKQYDTGMNGIGEKENSKLNNNILILEGIIFTY